MFSAPAWGPDEQVYRAQSLTVRDNGVRGFRLVADRFLSESAEQYPSPLRWLWIVALALTASHGRRVVTVASLLALPFVSAWAFGSWWAAALVASSPLALALGRRALQDVTVALFCVACLGCVTNGSPLWFGAALFALLSTKEAALLFVPAFAAVAIVGGQALGPFAVATASAIACWALATRIIVGGDCWRVFAAMRSGHASEYSELYQRGAPHRLLVDLMLVSPAALLVFVSNPSLVVAVFCAAAIAAHALSPVRNVRTILAADVAMRAPVAIACPWWGIVALVAVDVAIFWRIRDVYDPTTNALTKALKMT